MVDANSVNYKHWYNHRIMDTPAEMVLGQSQHQLRRTFLKFEIQTKKIRHRLLGYKRHIDHFPPNIILR